MPDVSPASDTACASVSTDATRALIRDLHAASDRARDERLRLAQAQKQQQSQLDQRGGPAPVDQITTLTDKIKQLDLVVQDRLGTLAQAEHALDQRTERVNAMRHVIQTATDAFAKEVERAQQFQQDIDAAKQAVRDCAGVVADEVREQLAQTEEPIATRLKQLVEMDRAVDNRVTRMQQMHKQAAQAVDKHLARSLNDAKEQATELAAPIKAELDKHLLERTEALEQAVQGKIAELDVDVEEALAPLTRRFEAIVDDANRSADELAAALPERVSQALEAQIASGLADLDRQAQSQLSQLEADAAKRVTAITRLAQSSGQSLAAALAKLGDEARTRATQTEEHLRRRITELRDGAQSMADLSTRQIEQRFLDARSRVLRRRPMLTGLSGNGSAELDARFAYSASIDTPDDALSAPQAKPVIQGPIVAESLDAFSRRAARDPRNATQDAA